MDWQSIGVDVALVSAMVAAALAVRRLNQLRSVACGKLPKLFLVAGASAVQVGTANFFNPKVTTEILDELPIVMEQAGISDLSEIIGTLEL